MTNKILYIKYQDYLDTDFDNAEPIRITADELHEEIFKAEHTGHDIYLGKIIVEGDFFVAINNFKDFSVAVRQSLKKVFIVVMRSLKEVFCVWMQYLKDAFLPRMQYLKKLNLTLSLQG